MGNVECRKCISDEKEMFAEIILGKNKSSKNNNNNNNILQNI